MGIRFADTQQVNLRYVLVAVSAAVFADIVTVGLHQARVAPSLDGVQILVWVASFTTVLVGIGIGVHRTRVTSAPGESVLIGVVVGGFALVLSWAPVVVLLVLYPPS